jgi:hypothetical protein
MLRIVYAAHCYAQYEQDGANVLAAAVILCAFVYAHYNTLFWFVKQYLSLSGFCRVYLRPMI